MKYHKKGVLEYWVLTIYQDGCISMDETVMNWTGGDGSI